MSDRFLAGTWEIEGWLESDQAPPGHRSAYQTHKTKVSELLAQQPPVVVFFKSFYGREDFSNIRFEKGLVEGDFAARAVDDIAGQTVPISGTYAADSFDVTFGYSAFGMKARQVVRGRLVDQAG